ncbi:hypothetical protein HPB48_005156 [Haemaphysalis longicornis]|uniref:Uncharacterized protein n=1 Tax=Haemaphysalis longicornis TaxID=44386 RepID=A0A9J6FFC5_HAELO|nr:hypothetical protein HPB48_005156 [Haemaphysalis longicornis]
MNPKMTFNNIMGTSRPFNLTHTQVTDLGIKTVLECRRHRYVIVMTRESYKPEPIADYKSVPQFPRAHAETREILPENENESRARRREKRRGKKSSRQDASRYKGTGETRPQRRRCARGDAIKWKLQRKKYWRLLHAPQSSGARSGQNGPVRIALSPRQHGRRTSNQIKGSNSGQMNSHPSYSPLPNDPGKRSDVGIMIPL